MSNNRRDLIAKAYAGEITRSDAAKLREFFDLCLRRSSRTLHGSIAENLPFAEGESPCSYKELSYLRVIPC